MSEVKVNKISPRSGTDVTLGDSGDTFTIPSGATLVNNGTASGFGDNLEWQSSIVTAATITVTANKGYWIDTTSNACTITLPASASVGDTIEIVDYARTWGTNAVTINTNGLNFQGGTSSPIYSTNGSSIRIVYSGATQGWIPTNDDESTNTQSYSADMLVIAGGGGGGANGGGGGAGGYRTSTQDLSVGSTYTITVGDGGAKGQSAASNPGSVGSNSSISGTGLTTITSAGGGFGGGNDRDGGDGGSGGGGGNTGSIKIGGSGNTPSTTPAQGFDGGNSQGTTYGGGSVNLTLPNYTDSVLVGTTDISSFTNGNLTNTGGDYTTKGIVYFIKALPDSVSNPSFSVEGLTANVNGSNVAEGASFSPIADDVVIAAPIPGMEANDTAGSGTFTTQATYTKFWVTGSGATGGGVAGGAASTVYGVLSAPIGTSISYTVAAGPTTSRTHGNDSFMSVGGTELARSFGAIAPARDSWADGLTANGGSSLPTDDRVLSVHMLSGAWGGMDTSSGDEEVNGNPSFWGGAGAPGASNHSVAGSYEASADGMVKFEWGM